MSPRLQSNAKQRFLNLLDRSVKFGSWAIAVTDKEPTYQYTLFFYKQLVYKQLALSLKIAKQLLGLNHLATSNNIKLQITGNRFVKDSLGVNQSSKTLH